MPKYVRTTQPQQIPEIDWDNPLTKDLRAAWIPRWPNIELVHGLPLVPNATPKFSGNASGLATRFTAGALVYEGWLPPDRSSGSVYARAWEATAPPLTVAALARVEETSSNTNYPVIRGNGSGDASWGIGLYRGSDRGLIVNLKTAGGFVYSTYSGIQYDITSSPKLITLSINPTTWNAWAGDAAGSLSGATPSGDFYYEYNDNHRALSFGGGYKSGDGPCETSLGLVWWRALTREEHLSLSRNPWQLFRPERVSKVFLPPAVTSTTKKWVPKKIVRTTQPQVIQEIDDSNPLTRDLGAAVLPSRNNAHINVRTGKHFYQTYWEKKVSRHGVALTFSGSGAQSYTSSADFAGRGTSAPATIMAVATRFGNLVGDATFFGAMTDSVVGMRIGYSDTAGWYARVNLTGGTYTFTPTPNDFSESAVIFARCVPTGTGSVELWINGKLLGSSGFFSTTWQGAGVNGWYVSGEYNRGVHLGAVWPRGLTDAEIALLNTNPWQLFKPDTRLAFTDHLTLTPVYVGRPISDVSVGAWLPSSGGALAPMLDEEVASDADYIYVESASTCEVALTALGDPGTSTGHRLSVRMVSPQSKSAKVSIRQGASTEIASFTQVLTNSPVTYHFDLSGAQIDSITNYADLRLRIEGL